MGGGGCIRKTILTLSAEFGQRVVKVNFLIAAVSSLEKGGKFLLLRIYLFELHSL